MKTLLRSGGNMSDAWGRTVCTRDGHVVPRNTQASTDLMPPITKSRVLRATCIRLSESRRGDHSKAPQ